VSLGRIWTMVQRTKNKMFRKDYSSRAQVIVSACLDGKRRCKAGQERRSKAGQVMPVTLRHQNLLQQRAGEGTGQTPWEVWMKCRAWKKLVVTSIRVPSSGDERSLTTVMITAGFDDHLQIEHPRFSRELRE
jgi:hypothetical protein